MGAPPCGTKCQRGVSRDGKELETSPGRYSTALAMPGPFLGTAPAPGTVPQWPQPRRKSGDAMAVENWTWTQDDPGFFASTVDNTYPTSVEGKHEDPR